MLQHKFVPPKLKRLPKIIQPTIALKYKIYGLITLLN